MCIVGSKWAKSLVRAKKYLNPGFYCLLCARQTNDDVDLCPNCAAHLPLRLCTDRNGQMTALCPGCGQEHSVKTLSQCQIAVNPTVHPRVMPSENADPAGKQGEYCESCQTAHRHLQLHLPVVAPYRYAFPMDQLIKKMKYRQDRRLSRVLGTLLGRAASDNGTEDARRSRPEVLLPMPLHPEKYRQRGFNQAEDIAYWAGKIVQIEMDASLVSRAVDTGSLSGLNRQERQLRILGAFRANKGLFGTRVAIVDDVLTTGASARELARELYDSGASSVELWVLARTSNARRVG